MTAPRFIVMNADPEPLEVQVPIDSLVALDLVDTFGLSGPDLAATLVEINGQKAYENGAFFAPFDGPSSATSTPYAGAARIVCHHTSSWTTLSIVTVHVVSQTTAPPAVDPLDETYSFRIEDRLGPRLVEVTPLDLRTLRARFADTSLIRMVDATGPHDALNPGLYSVIHQTAPAVDPSVVSVDKIDNYTVRLNFEVQLTAAAEYLLHVADVADEWDNVIGPPDDELPFTALGLGFPDTRRWDLWRMLPEMNRREDEAGTGELRLLIRCLQEITDVLLLDVDRWSEILDPDLAPERYLRAMLADLGNPFAFDLSEIDMRRLIRVLLDIYRRKGTAIGIVDVIRFFLGLECTVLCYWDEETWVLGVNAFGDPVPPDVEPTAIVLGPGALWGRYSFEVIFVVDLTDEERWRVRQLVDFMKPAHTHLIRIVEPTTPPVYDHIELGVSLLDGVEWDLHG